MNAATFDYSVNTVGMNKDALRVWLQGKLLARAGWLPNTPYEVINRNGSIVLVKKAVAKRIVSCRVRNDREIPIIDLNSNKDLACLEGLSHVGVYYRSDEIEITPLASELRARERLERTAARIASGEPLQVGSIAHGGGVTSHAVHEGFAQEGIEAHLAFANEIRAEMIEQSMQVNPVWAKDTIALNGPMQEIMLNKHVMNNIPQVDYLELGLPCTAATVATRCKGKTVHPEGDPKVGHLVVSAIAFIAQSNPTVIKLEQVVPFASSASMDILRNQLRDMQYDVHEVTLDGADWNALEHRKRLIMVAVTKGMEFDFSKLEKPAKITRTVGEILEPIALDDPRWSKMEGLKEKAIRDQENGKSFAMQIVTADSTKVPTLTAGMQRNRSTDCKIAHPTDPELLRIPTPIEHAAAKDIPPMLIKGMCPTVAHELLGQSVIYKKIVAVAKLACRSLKTVKPRIIAKPAALRYDDLPLFQAA